MILLNVKLGSDNTGRELVMGKEGLGVMNENWELFAGFSAQNDMVIGSAVFPHKRIHKLTWTSPDQTTRNQIDHMTISRRWRRTMEDVRVYIGADAGSDHELMIASLKVRLATSEGTSYRTTTDNSLTLPDSPDQRHDFCNALQNRYQTLTDQDEHFIDAK